MKTVYTYGVFDLLHNGHAELLKEAKALGDRLIVGVFTDEVAESFKRKPLISQDERMALLRELRSVDQVVLQDELDPSKNFVAYEADVLVKGPGAGWEVGKAWEAIPGYNTVKTLGKEIHVLNYHAGVSTTELIEKIKKL